MTLNELYHLAEDCGVDVSSFPLPESGSLSLELDGRCYIGLDSSKRYPAGEAAAYLGHELGHCLYGGFYNAAASRDTVMRHEVRADKWYIENAIPKSELFPLLEKGYNTWEIAEIMETTEEYIQKACSYYERIEKG